MCKFLWNFNFLNKNTAVIFAPIAAVIITKIITDVVSDFTCMQYWLVPWNIPRAHIATRGRDNTLWKAFKKGKIIREQSPWRSYDDYTAVRQVCSQPISLKFPRAMNTPWYFGCYGFLLRCSPVENYTKDKSTWFLFTILAGEKPKFFFY